MRESIDKKRGISLIVLVITIIVIIILAGAIILNLSENNPIESANKATFLSDVTGFKEQLELYKGKKYLDKAGDYDSSKLQADETSVIYAEKVNFDETIGDVIPALKDNTKYVGQFVVVDGKLVYQGSDNNRQSWSTEAGIEVVIAGEPTVTIMQPADTVVKKGTDVVYTVKFASNVALTNINLSGKVEVLDNNNVPLAIQPNITIGTVIGTNSDVSRQVNVTIDTDILENGEYKLKIKSGAVTNANGISNTIDKISLIGFNIDNIAPENPKMFANPSAPTNGNVLVTITYSTDTTIKEYSLDTITWYTYTSPVVVTDNGIIVYARGKDLAKNETGVSSITIDNIDRYAPIVVYGTNGATNVQTASTLVTVSDVGISNLNLSTLEYVWDTQNTTTPSSGWTTFTNGTNVTKTGVTGTYYLWVKASDKEGNNVTTVSNNFTFGETVSTINKTFSGATNGYSYNNPVIPAGFVAVNTTDASWDNLSTDWDKGLVIQDESGNQFVWVPVDGTNVAYSKWCTTELPYSSISDDTTPVGFSTTNITTTYKGFYIARYESMFDYNGGSIRLASKKSLNKTSSNWSTTRNETYNGYLWNFINYTDSKTYAENMDTSYGYNTSLVGTNLITGAQWDTVLKWVQNSGKNVTDSRTWGNYSNSTYPANVSGYGNLKISGYSNNWKAKNIYDLAGNLWEWTNEIYTSESIYRGGNCGGSGSTYPADFRSDYFATYLSVYLGFRVGLYVL